MRYTDLHCHLLWGIDDGAKTEADALAMARALVSLGFEAVAPSPHARPEYPSAAACAARREELQASLAREAIPLTLHAGAENVLSPELLAEPPTERRTIAGSRYLLAEAPYLAALPGLGELLFRLQLKGVKLLVAHPERCREFERPGRAAEVVRAGGALQLDLGALTNRYGPVARRLARQFLEEGLYAVAATDLHHPHDAERWVGEAIGELRRLAGAEAVQRLLGDHPARLVRGQPLPELDA